LAQVQADKSKASQLHSMRRSFSAPQLHLTRACPKRSPSTYVSTSPTGAGVTTVRCMSCGGELCLRQAPLIRRYAFGRVRGCTSCGKPLRRNQQRWRCEKGCDFSVCECCARRRLSTSMGVRGPPGSKVACKYGAGCWNRNSEHSASFSHPGDADYRYGRVVFENGQRPVLQTLWDIFRFFDPKDSGHLPRGQFGLVAQEVEFHARGPIDIEAAWVDAGGKEQGHVSFVRFASWVGRVGIRLPVGLDISTGTCRPCRFRHSDDGRCCTCTGFRADCSLGGSQCICGHSAWLHRSDVAEQSIAVQLLSGGPSHWKRNVAGLVDARHRRSFDDMQMLLDATHKENDNWTRDRGCSLHGINACPPECVYINKAPVPTGYRLVNVQRNQNPLLWARYSLMRSAILEQCTHGGSCRVISVECSTTPFDKLDNAPLLREANEWRLFHGSTRSACREICDNNFRLTLAGTGATWKGAGAASGLPLYGYGIYLTERITKADEYAAPAPGGLAGCSYPKGVECQGADVPLYSVLVCRVIGGRVHICTEKDVDGTALRRQVLEGSDHSVLGDREKVLNKPYREFVIYDRDQVYPEFVLTYARIMPAG